MKRIGYDKVLLAFPDVKVNNEIIVSLSLIIKYKVFYEEKEIFFDETTFVDKNVPYINVDNFLKCSVDKNEKGFLRFEKKFEKDLERLGFTFSWEIASYMKEIKVDDYIAESQEIAKEEFYKILQENIDNFDNSDNKSAQNTCYCNYPVEKGEKL
ncbi:hypothetical protein [Fusobacterium sp. SYSU M8D902]|uniref:hypothetical protein n=1 Tax=Fusobacterium sp. SYSU M8D902 TaxID=3159562 RepID=UPI0032E519AB